MSSKSRANTSKLFIPFTFCHEQKDEEKMLTEDVPHEVRVHDILR